MTAAALRSTRPGPESAGPAAVTACRPQRVRVLAGDGVRLSCSDYGGPRACHTVVFLHGWCLSEVEWAHHIETLKRRHGDAVRPISYDQRGHGRSQSAPTATYRVDQLADDLAYVLDELKVTGPLTLVGHSLGAMVALEYLRRHPKPDGLVLVAGAAGRLTERGMGRLLATPGLGGLCRLAERAPGRAVRILGAPMCAALGRWRAAGSAPHTALSDVIASALATTPVATAAGFVRGLRDFDATSVLESIRSRTVVVISGSADVLTPPEHSVELANAIRGATHVCVPGAGHMLPQQAPHVVSQAIERAISAGPALFGTPAEQSQVPGKESQPPGITKYEQRQGIEMNSGADDGLRPPIFIGEPGRAARRLAERNEVFRAVEAERLSALTPQVRAAHSRGSLGDRRCRVCGCTDSAACDTITGPCAWRITYDDGTGICTACPVSGYSA